MRSSACVAASLCVFILFNTASRAVADDASPARPVSGEAVEQLAAFDEFMLGFLERNKVPGGALAIVRDGEIVFSRGYGYADQEAKQPVQPESLFRIASVSKPITAAAILKLAEQKKLRLRDRLADYLDVEPFLAEGAKPDKRWKRVTIRHCLTHSGGWDRSVSYDPMFQSLRMAKEMQVELPVGTSGIIRYMRGQPLDFDPGERYAYSNFGYCLLGRVIEKVTGQPYERYVRQEVFAPLGVTTARIGGSLAEQRAEGEVRYYTAGDRRGTPVVGGDAGDGEVPVSYGAWHHEALDAHGGWIASAADLARFGAACAGEGGAKLLSKRSRRRMIKPQITVREPQAGDRGAYYGFGWSVFPEADNAVFPEADNTVHFQHGGALPCTAAILMHRPNGVTIAALFNLGQTPDGEFLGRQLDAPLIELSRQTWKEP
jgi:N-acyl-D-amino-acid deacylase